MKLFKIECKRQVFTLIYLICVSLLIVIWYKNFCGITGEEIKKAHGNKKTTDIMELDRPLLKEPTVEDDFYGIKYVENPELIMRGATDNLLSEYNKNIYATYPFGYYKAVSLGEKEQKRVAEILCEITGLSEEQLSDIPEGYFPMVNGSIIHIPKDGMEGIDASEVSIDVPEEKVEKQDKFSAFTPQISYEVFKDRMKEMEDMLGKGSSYSMKMLITYYGMENMTYEEAQSEFETMIDEDKLTGGFARLFCDVLSGGIGILPVFIAVFLWLKDIVTGSKEIVYAKKISSFKIVMSRYIAGVIIIMLPVLLLSFESLIQLIRFAYQNNYNIDYYSYIKYIAWWLLPTVMYVMASGTFFTILTDSPIAILIHAVWWVIDRGITDLIGGTTLTTLMIRHNTLREIETIKEQKGVIIANRLIYVMLSFLLLFMTVIVLEKKRRGKFEWWRYYTKITNFVKNKF